MPSVLLATDSDAVFEEVDAALASSEMRVLRVSKGVDVLPVIRANEPDLVLLDLQIGNMGGVATALGVRQEEGALRLKHRPIGLLLDRTADVFVAQQSGAEGWLIKPLDPIRLRRGAQRLLAGETVREGVAAI